MKKENIKLSIFWVFSFLVIIFMMTLTAHAEDPSYFPMQQNENSTLTSYVLDFINNDSQIDVENNYVATGRYEVVGNYTQIYIVVVSKSNNYIFAEKLNNGYQFSYYFLNPNSYTIYQIKYKTSNPSFVFKNSIGSLVYFQNLNSSLYDFSVSYASNLRVYTSANDDKQLVLKYGPDDPDPIGYGAAIIPPNALTPEYPSGLTAPSSVPPQVTINNYTWTTQPAFDNSSVINGIESIKDTLVWLATNIQGEISNLLSNLKALFEYVTETFQYYGNMIIETLNNMIQNFYDNMVSLVEGIYAQIEYIKEPLNQDVIWDNISTTSFVTNVNTIKTSLTSFEAAFTGVSEPGEYKIPIHLENLPSNWFGTQTTQYIDLGVINGTVKDGLRLFVWAMVTYGLVVTIFDSISNYINGGGDES